MRLVYIPLFYLFIFWYVGLNECLAQDYGTFHLAQNEDDWEYEELIFPDGSIENHHIFYDSFKEWLYYKNEKGKVDYFNAEQLISFWYKGSRYFSVPFNNGTFSFFKVEYEGKNTALLSKTESLNLMQYLTHKFHNNYSLCSTGLGEKEMKLCEISYYNRNYDINNFNGSAPYGRTLYPINIKSCLFILGEDGLKPIQMEFDKKILGVIKANRVFNFNSLKSLLGEDNFKLVREYAKENSLKEDDPEDLVTLIQYFDNLQN